MDPNPDSETRDRILKRIATKMLTLGSWATLHPPQNVIEIWTYFTEIRCSAGLLLAKNQVLDSDAKSTKDFEALPKSDQFWLSLINLKICRQLLELSTRQANRQTGRRCHITSLFGERIGCTVINYQSPADVWLSERISLIPGKPCQQASSVWTWQRLRWNNPRLRPATLNHNKNTRLTHIRNDTPLKSTALSIRGGGAPSPHFFQAFSTILLKFT